MFYENKARRDYVTLLRGCDIKRFRDGCVLSVGEPAPTNFETAWRVIPITTMRDASAFCTNEILKTFRKGVVFVCKNFMQAETVMMDLVTAGACA